MILLVAGLALVAMAVFWGPSWTSGGLMVLASLALPNADVPVWALAVGGVLAIAAGLGAGVVADSAKQAA